ncbi:MAG: hypothetical protein GY863_17520, partial [bacterium]|nr:hypothetical protein [bacterium]
MRNFFPVAKYESIMLFRTWKFWILAAVGMFFPIMINVVFILIERFGESVPGWLALEGSRPYFFFSFYNSIQIIIVIFLTSDFREKDKKHQIDKVMCSKSMTNFEYIFGKYFGIMIPLMVLTLSVLALLIIFNRIMNGTWLIEYYITYFLIMNLPGLIFITAFVIFTSSLLRNTAVVFIVIMIYTAAMWKLSIDHSFEINNIWLFTDYIGMFLPLYPSDLVGIVSMNDIILQRSFYILLGFFFIGMTITLFYPRLMQSLVFEWLVGIASFVCLLSAIYIMYGFSSREAIREQIAGNIRPAGGISQEIVGAYTITNCDLDFIFWENNIPIKADAQITLSKIKDTAESEIPFVLNPALKVSSVKDESGNDLEYTHTGIDLIIDYPQNISMNEDFDLTISYEGTIDDRVMFLNRGANDRGESETINDGPIFPSALDRKPNLISEEYTYMIPESYWYPALYNNYTFEYPEKRPVSFFTGECNFNVPEDRMAVSQGRLAGVDSVSVSGRRIYKFVRDIPVKALTVNVGNYSRFSANIAGVDINLYVSEEHNNLIEFFSEIKEDVKTTISDVFRGIKETTGLDYPYSSLSYVETPVVFQWFQNSGLHRFLLSQSGVVLATENMMMRSYQERFDRSRRRADRRGIEKSDIDIKKEIFLDVIIEDMFSENWWNDENLPTPLSAFWSDRINVTDELYPAYEYYFDKFLQGLITTKIRFFVTNEEDTRWRRDFEDQFSDWLFRRTYNMPVDTMHHLVRNYTMNELQPSTKNNHFHSVMRYKGQKIHQLLREIVPEEKHKEILRTFIQKHS